MPKYEYDPEEYDNDFTFEPNRSRKRRKFQREREGENQVYQQDNSIQRDDFADMWKDE